MPWKPGESGNPLGAKCLPKEMKELRKLDKERIIGLANKFFSLTKDQIKGVISNPESTAIELCLATVILQTIVNGDIKRLKFLLEWNFGKMVQEHSLGFRNGHEFLMDILTRNTEGKENSDAEEKEIDSIQEEG